MFFVLAEYEQDSLSEVLSWKFVVLQSYFGWIRMKTCSPKKFSPKNSHRMIFLAVTKNKLIVWNYIFSDPTSIYLFEFSNNNRIIKCKICSKLTREATYIILVSLLLTLNTFDLFLMFLMFLMFHVFLCLKM